MSAEGRTQRAIQITRDLLPIDRVSVSLLVEMTMYGVTPEDIEDTVAGILEYLEKTAPEAKKTEKANRIETHRKAVVKKWGVEEKEEG